MCLLVNKATDVYTALREREQTNYPTSKAWQRRVKGKKSSRKNPEKSEAHNITSFREFQSGHNGVEIFLE